MTLISYSMTERAAGGLAILMRGVAGELVLLRCEDKCEGIRLLSSFWELVRASWDAF